MDSEDEVANIDLAKRLLKLFGIERTDRWIHYVEDRPYNDQRYRIDGSKLRQLGWQQHTSFEDGIRMTRDWYNKPFARWNNAYVRDAG